MTEPRLTRALLESGGEDAYLRTAIELTRAEQRARIREDVLVVGTRAIAASPDRSVERTLQRGYGGEVMASISMSYLIASNEEWEGLDVSRLQALLNDAVLDARRKQANGTLPELDLDEPDNRTYFLTVGLARAYAPFAQARKTVDDHSSWKRMVPAFKVMFSNAMSIPKLKRRHREDYASATAAAIDIGSVLGILDHLELIPGPAGNRSGPG